MARIAIGQTRIGLPMSRLLLVTGFCGCLADVGAALDQYNLLVFSPIRRPRCRGAVSENQTRDVLHRERCLGADVLVVLTSDLYPKKRCRNRLKPFPIEGDYYPFLQHQVDPIDDWNLTELLFP